VDQQRPVHARAAVQLAVLRVRHADLGQQLVLTNLSLRRLAFQPRVKPAARHAQHPAHHLHRPATAVVFDEAELHGCSLAKSAAAFFRISRSISSRAFSLRSRRSSAFSAPSPLGTTPPSSDEDNFSTQARTLAASTPKLRAASGTL